MDNEFSLEAASQSTARIGVLFLVTGLVFVIGAFTLPATVGVGPIVLLALVGVGLVLVGAGRLKTSRLQFEMEQVGNHVELIATPHKLKAVPPPEVEEEEDELGLMEISFVEDRRTGTERRTGRERRAENETEPFVERRRRVDRRAGEDRRNPYEDFVLGLA